MFALEKLAAPIRLVAEGIGGLVRDLVSREIDKGIVAAVESRGEALEEVVGRCRQRLLGEPEDLVTEPPAKKRRLART